MTPHDVPLPTWVSVDEIGSWDQLVRDIALWPDVVAEATRAQPFVERDPERLLTLVALRHEFQTSVAQMQSPFFRRN